MDIHISTSIGLVLIGLSLVALLFIGYQLDDMHRRIKEIESEENHFEKIISAVTREVNDIINAADVKIQGKLDRLDNKIKDMGKELEEKLKPKPKGKVGRPKKVVNGKDDNS